MTNYIPVSVVQHVENTKEISVETDVLNNWAILLVFSTHISVFGYVLKDTLHAFDILRHLCFG